MELPPVTSQGSRAAANPDAVASDAVVSLPSAKGCRPVGTAPPTAQTWITGPLVSPTGYIGLLRETRIRFGLAATPDELFGHTPLLVIPPRPPLRNIESEETYVQHPAGRRRRAAAEVASTSTSADSVTAAADSRGLIVAAPDDRLFAGLAQLEARQRDVLEDVEAWERRVIREMTVVSFVTYVLRPELHAVIEEERDERGNIRLSEEKEFFALLHHTRAAKAIHVFHAKRVAVRQQQRGRHTIHHFDRAGYATKSPLRPVELYQSVDSIVARFMALKDEAQEGRQQALSPPPCFSNSASLRAPAAGMGMAVVRDRGRSNLSATNEGCGRQLSSKTGSTLWCRNGGQLPSLARTGLRTLRGFASYVDLLEEHERVAQLVFAAQSDEFRDIAMMFQREMKSLRAVTNRRTHLERLQYWRDNRATTCERLPRRGGGSCGAPWGDSLTGGKSGWGAAEPYSPMDAEATVLNEEFMGRSRIVREEEQERPYAAAYALLRQQKRRDAVLAEAVAGFADLAAEATQELLTSILPAYEHLQRRVIRGELRRFYLKDVEPAVHSVRTLAAYAANPSAMRAVVHLQRCFRRMLLGTLGWHSAHKLLGAEIRAKRVRTLVQRSRRHLWEYQMQLAEELVVCEMELNIAADKDINALTHEEMEHRVRLGAQEALAVAELRRAAVDHLARTVIGPNISRIENHEYHLRTQLHHTEEQQRSQLELYFSIVTNILECKEQLLAREREEREAVRTAELVAAHQLLSDEYDARELLRIMEDEKHSQFNAQRANFEMRCQEAKSNYFADHVEVALWRLRQRCMWRARLHTEVVETEAAVRRAQAAKHDAMRINLISEQLLHIHAAFTNCTYMKLVGDHYYAERTSIIHFEQQKQRETLVEAEEEEQAALVAFCMGKLHVLVTQHMTRRKAARRIADFYLDYRAGRIGAQSLRRFIQIHITEPRAVKRAKRECSDARLSLRCAMQRLEREKAELEEAIAESYQRERSRLELAQEVIVRQFIMGQETTQRHILEQNMVATLESLTDRAYAVLRDRDEPNARDAIERQRDAELAVIIQSLFQRVGKAILSVRARRIQRFWRAYCQRKAHASSPSSAVAQLKTAESVERDAIATACYGELFAHIAYPALQHGLALHYTTSAVPHLLLFQYMHLMPVAQTLAAEQCDRANLANLQETEWHCVGQHVTAVEGTGVAGQTATVNNFVTAPSPGDAEVVARAALWEERCAFLLRIIEWWEREARALIIAEEEEAQRLQAASSISDVNEFPHMLLGNTDTARP